jgi:hypothetical protein
VSTILDALRKLQRERAAESPSRDLRGSVTTETPHTPRRRRRGGLAVWLVVVVVLLLLAGGGYWLQQTGRLAGFTSARADAVDPDAVGDNAAASEAELAEAERELANMPAEPDVAALGEGGAVALPAEPIQPPPTEVAAEPAVPDTPEIAAERARLEEALRNARAAQEAQAAAEAETARRAAEVAQAAQAAEIAQAAEAARLAALPPAPPAAATTASAPLAKPEAKKAVVAATPPAARKPASRPARDPAPRYAAAGSGSTSSSAFPEVRVESIRWHPLPERRIASLQFEQQNAPEAREGDIVAGVLVYRIDPGAVELRIGSAQRIISPEP